MAYKTEENKAAFLSEYPKYAQITETARILDIDRGTVHSWINKDEAFAEQFNALKKDIDRQEAEFYVRTIREVVSDKETPAQSRLLGSFFMLKGLEPDKWREKTQPVLQVGDIRVTMAIPPYDDEMQLNQQGQVIEGEAVELIGEGKDG